MLKNLFALFLIILSFCAHTQAQQLKGQVLDQFSNEPIAFANVVYSEGAGTVTDIDGHFIIRTNLELDVLQVSCLGYQVTQVRVDTLDKGNRIYLSPLKYRLPTVDVMPGENPALPIMRKVIENKHRHNPERYDPFSCIMYHKMILDYQWPAHLNQEELEELKKLYEVNSDTHLYLFETVSEKQHLKKGVGKEKIISGRVSGYSDPILASFPALLQPFSFYNLHIELLGFSYLNPASKPGLSAYRFVLEDTYVNSLGDSIFYISYRPKENRNFRGLTGAFHIHGNSSAIKTVSASTTGTENGLRLFIRQSYQPLSNGKWFPKQLESSLQFGKVGAMRKMPFPIIGTGKSYVTAINTQPTFTAKDFNNIVLDDVALSKGGASIDAFRYEPLTARDSTTYHLLDSIGKRNHLDAILKTQLSLVKGYFPLGVLHLDLSKIIDYNDYEGLKLGLGLYTSPTLSENFTTGGYYTYGFGDRDEKYGGKLAIMPLKNKENKAYFSYQDDVYATGSFDFIDGIKANSSERFSRFLTETMDLSKAWKLGIDLRVLKYIKGGLYYNSGDISPQRSYLFSVGNGVAPAFGFDEVGVKLKWAHKETFMASPLGKISNGTNWPVLWFNAGMGRWGNSSLEYQRYEARIHKQFNYPNSMYTSVRVQGGAFSGDYPSTFLYSALGSYKSFTIFVPYTFGTMRLNEFAANEFAAMYLSHGIPLVLNSDKRIKPEIVLSTNIAFGNAPTGISAFSKGYYESGLYLKNLYSNFIFQYGLSVHYRYGAYQLPNAIDNWAFKLGVEFAF